MNLLENVHAARAEQPAELLLATVGSRTTAGITLILDGQTEATTKQYKSISTGVTLSAGDRVLVARISGTYVVLGKIV